MSTRASLEELAVILSVDYFDALRQRPHHLIDYLLAQNVKLTVLYRRDPPIQRGRSVMKRLVSSLRLILRQGPAQVRSDDGVTAIGILPLPLPFVLMPLQIGWLCFWSIVHARKKLRFVVSEGPYAGGVGTLLRILGMTKAHIYEDLDYFPGFYRGLSSRVTDSVENWIVRRADAIVTVSDELHDLRAGKTNAPIAVVSNGVDYRAFSVAQQDQKAEDLTLIFVGALESWAGVELSLRALAVLAETFARVRYIIIGPGDSTGLLSLAHSLRVADRVTFLGPRPKSELPRLLGRAHIGLAPFQPIPLMKFAFTLKVIEYMAAGLPVVGTDVGATGRVLKASNAGLAVPYEPRSFAQAIATLFRNQSLYKRMRQNGVIFAQQYDWNLLLAREWDLIRQVCH